MKQLVLLRHGKSDWSGDHPDLDRPIGARGRREAARAGEWLAAEGPTPDLVLVSPAARARLTWEQVRPALPAIGVRVEQRLYTWSGSDVAHVVTELSQGDVVLVVGHEPALSEFAGTLLGSPIEMPTSCLAVIGLPSGWASAAAAGAGRLLAHGRPPG